MGCGGVRWRMGCGGVPRGAISANSHLGWLVEGVGDERSSIRPCARSAAPIAQGQERILSPLPCTPLQSRHRINRRAIAWALSPPRQSCVRSRGLHRHTQRRRPSCHPPGRPLALSRCATARQPDPGAAQFSNTTNPRWLRSSEMRIWSTTRRTRLSMTSRLTRSRSESPIQTLLTSSRSGGSAIKTLHLKPNQGGVGLGLALRVEHDLAQLARGGAAERDAVAQQ